MQWDYGASLAPEQGFDCLDAMSELRRALDAQRTDESGRQWLFVPYDQLTDALGPKRSIWAEKGSARTAARCVSLASTT